MLRAERLTYRVQNRVILNSVSLSLERGTVVVLVGPNGAGKSTLLKILAGELEPSEGQVYLDEKPLQSYAKRELALRRAVMPQEVLLAFAFTAEEVVMMGRYPHTLNRQGKSRSKPADDRRIVHQSMEKTETTHLAERVYPTLSGGEQARVTLARVLAQETPVVFLDEPTASLDPRHQHLVMSQARKLADQGGTVLAVLHDLNLAAMYADQIALLRDGAVQAFGPPAEVLTGSILESVFRAKFQVTQHPRASCPLVVSLPLDIEDVEDFRHLPVKHRACGGGVNEKVVPMRER